MSESTELQINGERRRVEADASRSLLSVLRDELGLTGAKYGCGEGQCGACTVLLDGQPVRACITPLPAVAGRKIRTVEGLAQGERLHPVQSAFLEADALQCGYCTTGMIMSAVALLEKNPDPSEEQIAHHLEGNICRCGTYGRIVRAVRRAAQAREGAR
jgi:aerobic-type carbon monoxide dehydrogenase small subunit (CoxS/CutS family)